MKQEHVIGENIIKQAVMELSQGYHWIAYNTIPYFLEKGDVYFFKDRDSAKEFSSNNISEYDCYTIIHASSIVDLIKQLPYGNQLENILNSPSKNISIMNEKNVAYLMDNLKYMGFGETLNEALQNSITEGKKDFTLTLDTEFNKKPFSAALHFRKSDNSDLCFFNKWEASLKNETGKLQQTFYLNKGQGITLKEGYNLLEGRAVYKELSDKEGQKYHAWLQLDKKEMDTNGNYKTNQYHQNYGYDLEKTLSVLPIREFGTPDQREALLHSLEKGNRQAVTFERNGFAEKLFIEANPQFKSITAYDHNGTKISMNNLEKRFELVHKQAKMNDATQPDKSREKINGKEIDDNAGKQIKDQEIDSKKGLKESKNEGLLPKKEKANSLMEKKKTSGKKGLHL